MTAVERLLAVASAEVGYLEKASNSQLDGKTANVGSANYTKYARDLDALGVYHAGKQGFAWCDIFVDWCFIRAFGLEAALRMTGQPKGGYGAGCTESADYYRRMGRFFRRAADPQRGDQIFFSYTGGRTMAHTGLVERVAAGMVYTIEGNTSGANGVVANGGGVCRKCYRLDDERIGGYGRPEYSIVEDEDMDVGRFKELWGEMRKELQDNDSSGYSEKARAYFVEQGLVQGGGKLPDGSPNYMWEDVMTREQLVTVLYRLLEKLGLV